MNTQYQVTGIAPEPPSPEHRHDDDLLRKRTFLQAPLAGSFQDFSREQMFGECVERPFLPGPDDEALHNYSRVWSRKNCTKSGRIVPVRNRIEEARKWRGNEGYRGTGSADRRSAHAPLADRAGRIHSSIEKSPTCSPSLMHSAQLNMHASLGAS